MVTLLISLQFGWVLARTAHLCWAGGFTCKIVHLLGDKHLSTKWFRLPQSLVARFQGVLQEKEVGAPSFLRSGPGKRNRVTSAEFYS